MNYLSPLEDHRRQQKDRDIEECKKQIEFYERCRDSAHKRCEPAQMYHAVCEIMYWKERLNEVENRSIFN